MGVPLRQVPVGTVFQGARYTPHGMLGVRNLEHTGNVSGVLCKAHKRISTDGVMCVVSEDFWNL